MKKANLIVVAVAAALAAAPAARAMVVDVPLEIITTKADLIVVGEVTDAGAPAEAEMKVPDAAQPMKGFFRTYRIKVAKVIKEDGQPPKVEGDRVLTVWAQTLAPQVGGGPMLHVSDGPMYPIFRPGQKVVVILSKMPDKAGEYYLPSYFKNYGAGEGQQVADITRAAEVDKWAWGKAADGLQIAFVPSRTNLTLSPAPAGPLRPGMPAGPTVFVQGVVALRNVSDKPVAVSLYPEDRFLKITAGRAGGGDSVGPTPDLYEPLKRMDLAAFGPVYVKTLQPKQVLFIGPMGPAEYGLGFHMPLAAGKWQIRVSFTVKRAEMKPIDNEGRPLPLWTGAIESTPAEIEVSAPPARDPRFLGPPVRVKDPKGAEVKPAPIP